MQNKAAISNNYLHSPPSLVFLQKLKHVYVVLGRESVMNIIHCSFNSQTHVH